MVLIVVAVVLLFVDVDFVFASVVDCCFDVSLITYLCCSKCKS